MIKDIIEAIGILTPGAEYVIQGDNLDGLDWLDKKIKRPSDEVILAKIEELPFIRQSQKNKIAAAKAALLQKLGITEEEAQLLLGGR